MGVLRERRRPQRRRGRGEQLRVVPLHARRLGVLADRPRRKRRRRHDRAVARPVGAAQHHHLRRPRPRGDTPAPGVSRLRRETPGVGLLQAPTPARTGASTGSGGVMSGCRLLRINAKVAKADAANSAALAVNATLYPCTAASGAEAGPCVWMYDVVALVNTVLSNATPSEAPTCWVVFTMALATPASWSETPVSEVLPSGTKTSAMPTAMMTNAGRMNAWYDESIRSWVSHTMALVARIPPAVIMARAPTLGSSQLPTIAVTISPPENGR